MKAKQYFQQMSDSELVAWWHQYGAPRQAPFYPDAPRRAARAELRRRGYDIAALNAEVAAWHDSIPRPAGYDGPDAWPNGWAKWWGLMPWKPCRHRLP